TRVAPLHHDVEFSTEEPTEPIDEFVMEPGDILHVPRGCWHAVAASEGEPSLHLTCGLVTTTGADFLRWLTHRLIEHEVVRADVPRRPPERGPWIHTLAVLIGEKLTSPDVVEEYWTSLDEMEGGACQVESDTGVDTAKPAPSRVGAALGRRAG